MSEFESSSGLKTSREDFDSPIKPGKQIIAVPGDSTKEKAQHGKITIEVLNKEVRPILIAPQFPEGQYFVISTRPKRDTSPGEQFTKWKGKLEKVLQHTRDFMFSSCEDQNTVSKKYFEFSLKILLLLFFSFGNSKICNHHCFALIIKWRGKHITADTYCEVKISLFISLTNGPVGEIEVHSCLERGDQLKYAEFYLFLERKFSNIDVGIPVHPNMFPPTMTNVVTVDDSLCKEYAFSLLKMIRNSKHSNARVAALRSLGRLQMPANNILQDDEIGEEVVSIVDQLWNFNNSTDIEKEHTIFVMQRLIQSLEVSICVLLNTCGVLF